MKLTLAYGPPKRGSALRSLDPPPGANHLPLSNASLGRREWITCQRGLLGAVDTDRFDVVIAEFNPRIVSNLAALVLARRRGIPFVWWGQGFSRTTSPVATALRVRLVRAADALIVYGPDQARRFVEHGIASRRVFVAPNAIDTREIQDLALTWNRTDRRRILCIGRLVPEKKVETLLRAFARARPALGDSAVLTIVGEGPEKTRLRGLARKLEIEDALEFRGAVYDQARLAPIFNSTRIMVSPGGAGLSVVHSLAYGVPVVAPAGEKHGPEFDLLESGQNAFLCAPDDPHDLARTLVEVFPDAPRLERASRSALATVRERASLAAMVSGFEAAIRFCTSNVEAEEPERTGRDRQRP